MIDAYVIVSIDSQSPCVPVLDFAVSMQVCERGPPWLIQGWPPFLAPPGKST